MAWKQTLEKLNTAKKNLIPVSEMTFLFLDDIRHPKDVPQYDNILKAGRYANKEWHIVRSYDAFISFIQEKGVPGFISFDHDLGESESGYDCAKWLVEYCVSHQKNLPDFAVHSQNPVGKENIEKLLEGFKKMMNTLNK